MLPLLQFSCTLLHPAFRVYGLSLGYISLRVVLGRAVISSHLPPWLQYEKLVAPDSQAAVLQQLDAFLGLGPSQQPPAASEPQKSLTRSLVAADGAAPVLGVYNMRKDRVNSDGWPMAREQYQHLVQLVRPDAEE